MDEDRFCVCLAGSKGEHSKVTKTKSTPIFAFNYTAALCKWFSMAEYNVFEWHKIHKKYMLKL